MQTYFVTYSTGSYDTYVEHVYAIDAESAEALNDELIRAYNVYKTDNLSYMCVFNRRTAPLEESEVDDAFTWCDVNIHTVEQFIDFVRPMECN